jgi:hypothetical protein
MDQDIEAKMGHERDWAFCEFIIIIAGNVFATTYIANYEGK